MQETTRRRAHHPRCHKSRSPFPERSSTPSTAELPSQVGPSTTVSPSIRSYRSKKIRPCDNCRSCRQRCDIPRAGEACRLCVVTKKQCTFLRERRKAPSDLKKLAEREAELTAQMGKERPPFIQNNSTESAATNASTGSSPEPANSACLAHLTAYILSTRGAPLLVAEPVALDTEGDADEELYLVGTASERDSLILNNMTESIGPSLVQTRQIPGVRLRTVAPGVHFVFYKSMPYTQDEGAWAALRDMVTPALIPTVLQAFFSVEAQAHPVLRQEEQLSSPILRCMILTAGAHSPKARLWTLQVYVLDLDGRDALEPSGNFVTLGLAISTALLLGLHQDSELRTRLWWSLLNYDRFSSLTFGRPRHIVTPNVVPLPPRSASDTLSYDAFVSACELGQILDDLDSPHVSLASLAATSMRLDAWKNAADTRGLFAVEPAPPGVRSTQLLYLGSCIMVVRAIFDALDAGELDALDAARHSCLMACEGVVDFVAALTPGDLYGYWTAHSPFMLSLTLTKLVRIIVNAGEASVRETALHALRRFTSVLTDHQNSGWDVAQLAVARGNYFIPLLTRRHPEFASVLDSVQSGMPEAADPALADFLNTLVDPSGMHELSLGGLFSVPTL
ncbi:hypothetical protein CcaverHIS002_0109840 [Cutaneotrichosporon cavernicola]|nr:hypothetical protein CcaverHIS002_0109840 [Cutaneotrichosporon cavernicola]